MRILITGADGQLGQDLQRVLGRTDEIIGFDRRQMDVADAEVVRSRIHEAAPDAVIHAAAYTQVDRAEADVEAAFAVNAIGARNVAAAAAESGSSLVYVSTDYVFDGAKDLPYHEFDAPNPLSVYGKSKYEGERFVRMLHHRFYIVRTSWLYGRGENNFVGKILRAAGQGKTLRVVDDEWGSPTYTEDLAEFLSALIRTNRYGVYHASNTGGCTRYAFAKAILAEAGIKDVEVKPVSGAEFPAPAQRPKHSVLEHRMIRLSGLPDLPDWQDALARCMHLKRREG